jgi:hypothetical protein
MAIVEFSDSDLLRNKIIEPAWYTVHIDGHRDWAPSKDGQSNNCYMECTIEKNAQDGSTEYTGVPIELMFNDKPKAKGFIEGFLRGLGVDVQSKSRYDLAQAVGKRLNVFVENETYNGRLINRVNHKYKPVTE